MIDQLLEPFNYEYMRNAIFISTLVGSTTAFLSCYLILKGWSLMGDALAHSIVPGVAIAYLVKIPYSIGAFASGILSSWSMNYLKNQTKLKEDTIIGIVLVSFFSLGLFIASINPTSINLQHIVIGNLLAISKSDAVQISIICIITLIILSLKWKDILAVFFDEFHAKSIGLNVTFLKILFFTLLSASAVASLQTVGICLVISLVITPGASGYLLTDSFSSLIKISIFIGFSTCLIGSYLSYFMNLPTGALIVVIQTILFLFIFFFAPKYGYLKRRKNLA